MPSNLYVKSYPVQVGDNIKLLSSGEMLDTSTPESVKGYSVYKHRDTGEPLYESLLKKHFGDEMYVFVPTEGGGFFTTPVSAEQYTENEKKKKAYYENYINPLMEYFTEEQLLEINQKAEEYAKSKQGLPEFILPYNHKYSKEIAELPIGTTFGSHWSDIAAGSIDDRKFLDILHSPEMRKYDYLGLGLLSAPWAIFGTAAGLGGLASLAGTTAGNIIGNTAGAMALGKTLEEGQRYLFGRSAGDYVVDYLQDLGVNPWLAELGRPEYWLNPTGKYTGSLINRFGAHLDDPMAAYTNVGVNNSIPMSGIHSSAALRAANTAAEQVAREATELAVHQTDDLTNPILNEVVPLRFDAPEQIAKPITREAVIQPSWQLLHLPGYQLKVLMEGSPLEKSINKNGLINVNVLRSLLNSTSKVNKEIIENVLNTKFAGQKNIDYNDLRKAVLEELVTFDKRSEDVVKFRVYGVDGLGYKLNPGSTKFAGSSPDVDAEVTLFSSPKIPKGSAKHFNESTLGHTRSYTNPDEPDVFYVMESLSDWAQHNPKQRVNKENRQIALLNEVAAQGEDGFITQEAIDNLIARHQDLGLKYASEINNVTPHEKYIMDNNVRRLLLENLRIAAEKGKTKMRYPTPETAAKIQYYPKNYTLLPGQEGAVRANELIDTKLDVLKSVKPDKPEYTVHPSKKFKTSGGFTNLNITSDGRFVVNDDVYFRNLRVSEIENNPKLQELIRLLPDLQKPADLIYYETNYPLWLKQFNDIKASKQTIQQATDPADMTYRPEHQTILKKYTEFPDIYRSIIKDGNVRTVTDAKGNTWYEVDVPENFLDMELLYKRGGRIKLRFK